MGWISQGCVFLLQGVNWSRCPCGMANWIRVLLPDPVVQADHSTFFPCLICGMHLPSSLLGCCVLLGVSALLPNELFAIKAINH